MGYTLESFGIYPSVIEDMVSLAEKLAIEVTGNGSAIDDLRDWAIDTLQNNIDVEDITNSIIRAYFEEVQYLVGEITERIGIETTVYWEANCRASYIRMKNPIDAFANDYYERELVNLVFNGLVGDLSKIFSSMDIGEEVAEVFVNAVEHSIDRSREKIETVPQLLKLICLEIFATMESVLGVKVGYEFNDYYKRTDCLLDESFLLPEFTVYDENGDIYRIIEGAKTFIGTFKSDAFREVLENKSVEFLKALESVKKED